MAAIAGLALLGSVGLIPVAAPPANPASASQLAQAPDPVIATAGDIACDPSNSNFNGGNGAANSCRQMYTSNLLVGANLAAVLDLGDNQYYCGGYQAFLQSYGPSWGRVKSITYPAVGNHEYLTSGGTDCTPANAGAAGYFAYFGAAAGQPGQGYYSYDIGTWHIIALNSNCGNAGGCGATSPQGIWLANDLKTHANFCTLAYWHIPLFSSGGRANNNSKTFWQLLYDNNADLILSAHDHTYERFAPQTPSGSLDTSRGIREFIVGSGGANHTSFVTIAANSEVRNASTFGVLEITLHPTSYDWQFVPEAGQTFTDSGTTACHGATSDTTPPTAPANLTAMASSPTQVNLTWSASSDDVGVTGYKVYRNGVFLASSATTSYSDTTAQAATTYSYTVYAYDAAGNISPASNTATVTTPNQGDTQPPSTPDGLTATAATASQVNLAWSAATDDVGVAGYTIYRNGAAIATTSGPNATTYTDVSVAPSTTYTYTVDAFDAAGNRSPQSAGASVTTPPSNIHTITLNPTADTYIDSANPTVNHGTSAQLRVDGSPLVYSFLKFDLSAVPGTVTGLTLNVYATSSSGAGYAVRSVADNSWSESTLTWNNAPPIGTSDAGQSGAFAANTLTTVNVSSLSNGNGMLSMAMLGINSTAIAFSSREGTVKPQLVVSYQS
ncbi:MAG TPA: DNRLRE domain-containing protein [Streptosporangiaceae bacterium]